MPPPNTSKNRSLGLIFGFLFVAGGWAVALIVPAATKGNAFVIPVLTILTLVYIFIFVLYIVNPKKFIEQQNNNDKALADNPLGQVLLTQRNSLTIDIEVFKIIYKKFRLFLPFLFSVIAVFAVILIPLFTGLNGKLLGYFYQNKANPEVFLPVIFLIYSFICCSIYVLGYITLGYILRRQYLNIKETPIKIITRYFKVFWFVILLSVIWVLIFLTISKKRKKDFLASLQTTATLGVFSAIKLFLYLNIVRVSLGDEKSGFRDTYEFARKDIYQVLRVWFGSGLIVGGVLFMFLILLLILDKFGMVGANQNIIAPVFISLLVIVPVFRAFAEQIGLFGVYMKDRYNIEVI